MWEVHINLGDLLLSRDEIRQLTWWNKKTDLTPPQYYPLHINSLQFSSVTQSCLIFCNPVDHIMPGLPVHHQLPEFTQIHLHGVCDTIQSSHFLLSPSPPAFNLSQHQSLS